MFWSEAHGLPGLDVGREGPLNSSRSWLLFRTACARWRACRVRRFGRMLGVEVGGRVFVDFLFLSARGGLDRHWCWPCRVLPLLFFGSALAQCWCCRPWISCGAATVRRKDSRGSRAVRCDAVDSFAPSECARQLATGRAGRDGSGLLSRARRAAPRPRFVRGVRGALYLVDLKSGVRCVRVASYRGDQGGLICRVRE